MVDVLMRLETPGDAVRVVDKGEEHYYVAVLLARKPPSFEDILKAYRQDKDSDKLLWATNLTGERRLDFRKKVMEQLRREAAPDGVDSSGNWAIPKELARKQDESQ